MTKVLLGIDVLVKNDFAPLRGAKVGLLVNQASIDSNLRHTISHFFENPLFELKALFGPQHGIYGQTQDNMIEWEGSESSIYSVPLHSLYGQHRMPTDEMLSGIDTFVIDLQDVGSRYYTFIWTCLLCLEKCIQLGIRVIVLDRPNPINGIDIEGSILDENYTSFVGLYPIPIRHGMTIGELLFMMYSEKALSGKLLVVTMDGWKRNMWYEETSLPWVIPSPNMPTVDTACVYPGFCLLEGTALSEGRGTTRPFELFGAPYIDPFMLERELADIPGLIFRPCYFEPTFQKHKGIMCGGGQLHVTDRKSFSSLFTVMKVLSAVMRLWGREFEWKKPPYEYEYEKLPIDILCGGTKIREALESGARPEDIVLSWKNDEAAFRKRRQDFLFYE